MPQAVCSVYCMDNTDASSSCFIPAYQPTCASLCLTAASCYPLASFSKYLSSMALPSLLALYSRSAAHTLTHTHMHTGYDASPLILATGLAHFSGYVNRPLQKCVHVCVCVRERERETCLFVLALPSLYPLISPFFPPSLLPRSSHSFTPFLHFFTPSDCT